MRMVLFFDLPTLTDKDKREYRKFRKLLIKNGFVMVQESVYTKMLLNQTAQKSVVDMLKKNKPASGMVQALVVTEKQFSNMVNISGKFETDVVDNDERLIII
ncbi:MAG: CRISPR-associated endonuclease Cas2 [Parasporobacterium sp.]|nr:CRISPR-associated endonuclease Cas2 [Parasporobacterium sp.]